MRKVPLLFCQYLDKNEVQRWLPQLFSILHENMSVIAPTGNTYDEDYTLWSGAVGPAMEKENRKIILIFSGAHLIGYLQYYTNETTFMIEEAQIKPAFQGRGVLRSVFAFVSDFISPNILYTEAYANKKNTRSQTIIESHGFTRILENKNGNCYHYRADCQAFLCRVREKRPHPGADDRLQESIQTVRDAIAAILAENAPTVYLYGSVALDDFQYGWSDIDLLVLTEKQISSEQAQRLVHLRQELSGGEPENTYYRLFEGGMLSLSAFLTDTPDTVVYWGTSGERIADRYVFDSFCKLELLDHGVLLYGKDVRGQMRRPIYEDLKTDVRRHYETIREYSGKTGRSLYSFGWLLDISRCIYTLRTGRIIAKTKAGEWALENGLCPDAAALETALRVRKEARIFKEDETLQAYAAAIGPAVQKYADVLERELEGICK
jgi:predicted nucleotidyltransferase/RimJ/RimL family protein N-acetyltransferase